MGMRPRSESYASLIPLMEQYGAGGSPEVFFHTVNTTFHDNEAAVYDDIHRNMWTKLPNVISVLTQDAAQSRGWRGGEIRLLDIGCGTGLATELFLRTPLGQKTASVCLVDTSSEMLSRAIRRVQASGLAAVESHLGPLEELNRVESFDIALASSVLHHIPDLQRFFAGVSSALRPGGLFIHCQDPNADADSDVLCARMSMTARLFGKPSLRSLTKKALNMLGVVELIRTVRDLTRQNGADDDYIAKTNGALLAAGVITHPLPKHDLWRITDIHVGDGLGVSLKQMRVMLPELECVSARTYQFFGERPHPSLASQEQALFVNRDMNGQLLAAVWRKRIHID